MRSARQRLRIGDKIYEDHTQNVSADIIWINLKVSIYNEEKKSNKQLKQRSARHISAAMIETGNESSWDNCMIKKQIKNNKINYNQLQLAHIHQHIHTYKKGNIINSIGIWYKHTAKKAWYNYTNVVEVLLTLLELLQTKMYRQLFTYFSMIRRSACCAFRVSWSASEMITTIQVWKQMRESFCFLWIILIQITYVWKHDDFYLTEVNLRSLWEGCAPHDSHQCQHHCKWIQMRSWCSLLTFY